MPNTSTRKRPVRRREKSDRPNPIDVHVGQRVRLKRVVLGWSQEALGEKVGLTFQQVQKYERGANKISASRLWELAWLLDVPIPYFFSDIPDGIAEEAKRRVSGEPGIAEEPADSYKTDPLARREILELVRAYVRITDPAVRHRLFELTKTLAELHSAKPSDKD